jgi:hypothetical protein
MPDQVFLGVTIRVFINNKGNKAIENRSFYLASWVIFQRTGNCNYGEFLFMPNPQEG